MSGYLKVAEQLLVNRIISNDFPVSGRVKAGLGLGTLSGFFVVIGLCFFVYAAHLWLADKVPPDQAALLTGVVAFGFAGLVGLAALAVLEFKKFKARQFKQEIQHKIEQAISVANDEFGEPIRENPKAAVTVATIAGLLVGNRLQ